MKQPQKLSSINAVSKENEQTALASFSMNIIRADNSTSNCKMLYATNKKKATLKWLPGQDRISGR